MNLDVQGMFVYFLVAYGESVDKGKRCQYMQRSLM